MDRAQTANRILQLLLELGSSSSEIAATLQQRGVRGARESTIACPLAMYLRGHGLHSIAVHPRNVDVPERLSVALPNAHQAFVKDFDAGCYPDLVEREAQP